MSHTWYGGGGEGERRGKEKRDYIDAYTVQYIIIHKYLYFCTCRQVHVH